MSSHSSLPVFIRHAILKMKNSFTYDSQNLFFNDSQSVPSLPPQLQFEGLTYVCYVEIVLIMVKIGIHFSRLVLKYIIVILGIRPLFYFDNDDEEYIVIWRRSKAIIPDEPSEEPEDPLIMGEKELSTIPEKDKSSGEDLFQIPSESRCLRDIYDHSDAESLLSQDIPITSPKLDFLSEEFTGEFAPIPPSMDKDKFDEEEVDCYDHDISSDNDSYENIKYVEASPLNLEYDS
ncbi:hypothetical protein Tco_0365566 [Tanacetum coccineum]